ncbi:MAG: serine hydrolase domain-containing protein [Streptosporangiaceae bacterium]
MPSDFSFAAADEIVRQFHQRGGQPAVSYGIVRDGSLVHAAGFGARSLDGPAPDERTVFRIASMSKSFTASAILLLRDAGALSLDDPAAKYVPELADWGYGAADAAPLTVRNLLTMTAGFPTDDPWGDRQQGLPLEEFDKFLAGGVGFNWAPGTRFEYSNLGYAILGRVITAVTGAAYQDYIRDRLLRPLGMTSTGFEAAQFDPSVLARGYRREQGATWSEVPLDPCGAFAPMGGVFSCVRDLTRWVSGFVAAFPPGDPQAGGPHPVRRATRREMQLPQVLTGWDKPAGFPGDTPPVLSAYGFGLFVEEYNDLGRVVSHSGGYPGFGSNMRWHPASGTGVIALGNSTYSAMMALAARLLAAVVPQREAPVWGYGIALAPARPGGAQPAGSGGARPAGGSGPWPETLAAREAVSGLLRSWDDDQADRLFSPNVAQDAPFAERRQVIALIRERIGDFGDDTSREPEFDTPAHCRWWLAGERGVVQAQLQLNPERPPRVQSLTLAVPPVAGTPLSGTLDALLTWMNGSERDWPARIQVAGTVDAGLLARRLRMGSAWAGPCRPGFWQAGDGAATATVELVGKHATLTLSLVVDPASGLLRQADILP